MTEALEATDLTKVFEKDIRAVDGITFSVHEGELFGLLGPNGAGKTTTLKMLSTIIRPTSGEIKILGISASESRSSIRQALGTVPQEISADGDLTGYENLLIFAKLYYVFDKKERESRIRQALDYMGLTERASDLVKHYSGGMMRRLEIAQALVNKPKILFLDEPSIGLDPAVRREVWKHIRSLNEEFGMTIVLTTHDMNEADELCARIAIMNAGKIVAEGTPSELKQTVGNDLITVVKQMADNRSRDPDEIVEIKADIPASLGRVISENDDSTIILPRFRGEVAIPRILAEYQKAGIDILSISLSRPTLDDVFLKYTNLRMQEAESVRGARFARRSFRRHAK